MQGEIGEDNQDSVLPCPIMVETSNQGNFSLKVFPSFPALWDCPLAYGVNIKLRDHLYYIDIDRVYPKIKPSKTPTQSSHY